MSQPSTSDSLKRIRTFAGAALGAILVVGALVHWQIGSSLDEDGRTAAAEVVSVTESRNGAKTATVRFTTPDGRTITTTNRPGELADPPPAVGSTITVVYDPEEPQARVRDPLAPDDGIAGPVVAAAAGLAGLGLLLIPITRWRARARR